MKQTPRQAYYNYRRSVCGSPEPLPSLITRSEGNTKSSGRRSERASEREDEEEPRRRGPRRDRSDRKAGVGEQGSKHLLPLPTAKLGHISDTLALPASPSPSFATSLSLCLASSGRLCCAFSCCKACGVTGLLTFPFAKISYRGFWSLLWRRCPAASSTGGASVLRRVLCACLLACVLFCFLRVFVLSACCGSLVWFGVVWFVC